MTDSQGTSQSWSHGFPQILPDRVVYVQAVSRPGLKQYDPKRGVFAIFYISMNDRPRCGMQSFEHSFIARITLISPNVLWVIPLGLILFAIAVVEAITVWCLVFITVASNSIFIGIDGLEQHSLGVGARDAE